MANDGTRRQYDREFKQEAVRLSHESHRSESGRRKSEGGSNNEESTLSMNLRQMAGWPEACLGFLEVVPVDSQLHIFVFVILVMTRPTPISRTCGEDYASEFRHGDNVVWT